MFEVRQIDFSHELISLCYHQANNPLGALVNILALRNDVILDETRATYSLREVQDLLIRHIVKREMERTNNKEAVALRKVTDEVGAIFPSLQNGTRFNVQFDSVFNFGGTDALGIFDFLDVKLVHGMLVDSSTVSKDSPLPSLTYDEARHAMKNRGKTAKEDIVSSECRSLLDTAPELITPFGLSKLHGEISDDTFVVLYRNHRFDTVYKLDDCLYILVNDDKHIKKHRDVVWERFLQLDEQRVFCGSDFESLDLDPQDESKNNNGIIQIESVNDDQKIQLSEPQPIQSSESQQPPSSKPSAKIKAHKKTKYSKEFKDDDPDAASERLARKLQEKEDKKARKRKQKRRLFQIPFGRKRTEDYKVQPEEVKIELPVRGQDENEWGILSDEDIAWNMHIQEVEKAREAQEHDIARRAMNGKDEVQWYEKYICSTNNFLIGLGLLIIGIVVVVILLILYFKKVI